MVCEMLACPECGGGLALQAPVQGEIVSCGDCTVELEVTSLQPLAVGLAPEEQEDWGE
jgi:alpha-aminoadipate/glutamate carrier protein LysW